MKDGRGHGHGYGDKGRRESGQVRVARGIIGRGSNTGHEYGNSVGTGGVSKGSIERGNKNQVSARRAATVS